MVPFHRLSLISESPFGDRWPSSSSNDRVGSRMPMQVANSPKHDGFVQTAQQLPFSWCSTLFAWRLPTIVTASIVQASRAMHAKWCQSIIAVGRNGSIAIATQQSRCRARRLFHRNAIGPKP